MARLCDVLSAHRAELLHNWTSAIRQSNDATGISTLELLDHLPMILDELNEVLRASADEGVVLDRTTTAGRHGVQRFRLGFVVEAVIREYALLHRCILEVIHERGVAVTTREQGILADFMFSVIADAVTQYGHQRDAELRRQANEHFAFLAHELRNPLASVRFAFGSIHGKELLRAAPLAQVLSRGINRMNDLIESALRLAIAREGMEPHRARLRVKNLVATAIADTSIAAGEKDIKLDVVGDDNLEIDADQRLMFSVLTNLLDNAVKFSRNGGTVRVRCAQANDKVIIDVEDSCGGLPRGAVEKMFLPFVQVGEDKSGYGLGLAIARQAVEAHSGELSAHDHPGEGCTMTIELPQVVAAVERGSGA